MIMSKSRLEKFLYALYSLDSSDLPNPLSRIEELYKCLVTGEEAPTFEPLSRVEKYLMAILGVYDVDSLPNPLSRVEVLLHKLATGDDNLDDIKSFLSRHEELLAEIIRNGGVGGNIDIEYVLYTLSTEFNTLYNTAEKPVKSAILKGNTLVNHFHKYEAIMPIGTGAYRIVHNGTISKPLKPNTSYLFINHSNVGYALNISVKNDTTGEKKVISYLATNMCKFTTPDSTEDFATIRIYLMADNEIELTYNTFMLIEYKEGMENWDIPYFEGMQSVKMPVLTTTGKNLCGVMEYGSVASADGSLTSSDTRIRNKDFITLGPGSYTISAGKNYEVIYRIYDMDGVYLSPSTDWSRVRPLEITETSKVKFVVRKNNNAKLSLTENFEFQVEKGTTATTYEPYKSNILTVNEEIHLRGIGKVKDELNLLTGEVIKKFTEVTLDGSNNNTTYKTYSTNNEGYSVFQCAISESIYGKRKYNGEWISTFPIGSQTSSDWKNKEYVGGHWYGATNSANIFVVKLLTSSMSSDDINGFKEYLQHNPITIQYQLATESVKTVDLSVVDQDGNDTELSTFNDITHVTLSSEALIPEAELEVATKNEEVLNTLSLEMDDISTTQNALQETSDTQSENVDATMIATTEIYEQLL